MTEPSAERRSEVRVLIAVIAVVLFVSAVAAVAGLVNDSTGGPSPVSDGSPPAVAPPAVEDIGGPDEPGAPAIAPRPAAGMRAELDTYLASYGNVSDVEVLPIGADGKPQGSRFAERIAPGTRFLAADGDQKPPVFAEVVVTRDDGSRFAALLVYRPDATGKPAWSDLLTSTIP